MKIEDIRNDEAPDTTEAAEELAADDYEPYTDEERAAMSPEQRAEVERIEQAIEEFLARTKTYLQTPENRKAILRFLEDHDLRITPTSLLLAFEELSETGDLDLGERPQEQESEEHESQTASEPEQVAPQLRKKSVAWRNGREIEVGA